MSFGLGIEDGDEQAEAEVAGEDAGVYRQASCHKVAHTGIH